jgi:hypothetical protein
MLYEFELRGGTSPLPAAAPDVEIDGRRVRVDAGRRAGMLTALRLAASLGGELHDVQRDWSWRAPGPCDAPPPPGKGRATWTATNRVPGPANGLGVAPDGTVVVAYDPPRGVKGPPTLQVRSGEDLDAVRSEHPGLGAPVAVDRTGTWFAAGERSKPHRHDVNFPAVRTVALDPDGAGLRWCLGGDFGWLPGGGLLALTRHPFNRKTPPVGPAAAELSTLEVDRVVRAVVADPAGTVTATLAASPVLDETLYQTANLAVVAGFAVVASCSRVVGLPVGGGPPAWYQPPIGHPHSFVSHWYAAAADPAGQLVAFGGNHWHDDPNLLILETATGVVRFAVNTTAFGTRAPVRALAFHPDGWLAAGFGDGQVRHVSLSGETVAYRGIPGSLAALAFTPDGSALLVAGASTNGLRRIELTR